MGVQDVLVTVFEARAGNYVAGTRQVIDATQHMGRAIGGAVSAVGGLAGLSGGVGIASLVGMAVGAAKVSTSFDTLKRSLEAITHSGERAAGIMKFVDQLAVPSVFGSTELAEAASQLEAFGLQTERFLPIAEKLGTVFGGSREKLMEFVRALGYAQGGQFGEAIESLGSAGISRDALRARGLRFKKSGEFDGSKEQLLGAVEAETNARYGGLSASMASGTAARTASVMDNATRAVRAFGDSILRVALPSADALGESLGGMVTNGRIDRLAMSFEKLFNPQAIAKGAQAAVEGVTQMVERIPAIVEKNRENVGRVFDSALRSIRSMLPVIQQVAGVAASLATAFARLPEGIQTAVITLGLLNKGTGGLLGNMAMNAVNGSAAAGGTGFGSMLAKTITGPIGLIGGVLIAGAADLAARMSDAIDILEGKQADKAAVPEVRYELDADGNKIPIPGKPGNYKLHKLTAEEKKAEYERLQRERRRRGVLAKFGIDFEEEAAKVKGATTTAGAPSTDPAPDLQNQAERQTRALETLVSINRRQLDLQSFAAGGGELGRMGVQATELGGGRQGDVERQIVRLLRQYSGLVSVSHSTQASRATSRF